MDVTPGTTTACRANRRCHHRPLCPSASAPGALAAAVVAAHPEQGWSLLCNGVLLFEDTGAVTPAGVIIQPGRGHPISGLAISASTSVPR